MSGRSTATGSAQEWYFGKDERYETFDKSYRLPTSWSSYTYRADSGRKGNVRLSSDGMLLFGEGFHFGTIDGISSEPASQAYVSDSPYLIVQPQNIQVPPIDNTATKEALLRTLLLDASNDHSTSSILFQFPWLGSTKVDPATLLLPRDPDENELVDEMVKQGWDLNSFAGTMSTFDIFRRGVSEFRVGNRPFNEYFSREVTPCSEDASFMEFNIVMANVVGRRLVTTTTGHIGLAPATVKPGDKIYILLGCSMPVILRPAAYSQYYEVVGECFVDGFMKGEAFAALDVGEYDL